MLIKFSEQADKDLKSYIKSGNKALVKKVLELIKAIEENPFEGIGKPEHRIIYYITGEIIFIQSVKGHY